METNNRHKKYQQINLTIIKADKENIIYLHKRNKDVKVCDYGILIQLLCFCTLSVVLFYLLKIHRFGDRIVSPSSGGT
jgi:hypothetical protein